MKGYVLCVFLLCLDWSESTTDSRCPEIFCFLPCSSGYSADANGCPTCTCQTRQEVNRPVCDDLRCFVPCNNGYRLDSTNCMTCDCAPPNAVPAVNPGFTATNSNNCNLIYCLVACPNGYETDASGCPTCVCRAQASSALIKQPPPDKQLPDWMSYLARLLGQ